MATPSSAVESMLDPTELPARETVAFVERFINLRDARILDVGCGKGAVAAALASHGAHVVGIDWSEEAVEATRNRGITANTSDFLQYEDAPFDALLFSRSFHHIQPLDQAMKKIRSLLKDGGVLLIEDFAVEQAERPETNWRYHTASLLNAGGLLIDHEIDGDLSRDYLAKWHRHHVEHHVTTSPAMLEAVRAEFNDVTVEQAPYLYRYMVEKLLPSAHALELAEFVLNWENTLIDRNELKAIGLRIIARK